MNRIVATFMLVGALVAASTVPAEAKIKQWSVGLADVAHTVQNNQVVQVTGRLVSKNTTCWFTAPITVAVVDGPVFGTDDTPDGQGNFTINGTGPLGNYTISKPKASHRGDSGKKQICKSFKKKFTFN